MWGREVVQGERKLSQDNFLPGEVILSHISLFHSGPGSQSHVNYNELQLQFKSISSNFIGWICLQDHFYLAWPCEPEGLGDLEGVDWRLIIMETTQSQTRRGWGWGLTFGLRQHPHPPHPPRSGRSGLLWQAVLTFFLNLLFILENTIGRWWPVFIVIQ